MVGGFLHQIDETILEAGFDFLQAKRSAGRCGQERALQALPVLSAGVQHCAEEDSLFHTGLVLQHFGQPGQVFTVDRPGVQTLKLDHLLRRPPGKEAAAGNIGQFVTAFGLIHVMGAHQHRNAAG